MRRAILLRLLVLALAVAALVASGGVCLLRAHADQTAPAEERPVAESVVVVTVLYPAATGMGSGVSTDVGIITARHVVENAILIFVRSKARVVYRADTWKPLTGGDTAVLIFSEPPPIPALPLGALKSPKHVRCVAWWGRARDEGYLVDIHATAWPDDPSKVYLGYSGPWLRTSVPLQQGMSGAPLLLGRRVIGLASMRSDGDATTIFAAVTK